MLKKIRGMGLKMFKKIEIPPNNYILLQKKTKNGNKKVRSVSRCTTSRTKTH